MGSRVGDLMGSRRLKSHFVINFFESPRPLIKRAMIVSEYAITNSKFLYTENAS